MAPQLWLLRHGEAVPHDSKPDPERELTARGERQAFAAGTALARLGVEFDACYTSPKVRAPASSLANRSGVTAHSPAWCPTAGCGKSIETPRENATAGRTA